MKKILSMTFCLALLALHSLVCSCEKNTDLWPDMFQDGRFCELSVSLGSSETTKAIGQTSERERNIKSVEVLIFNRGTGQIDASAYVRDLSVTGGNYTLGSPVRCTYGEKEVWAIVNGPEQYSTVCQDVEALKSMVIRLTDNAADALVMVGDIPSLALNTVTASVNLEVSRLCSAVVLRSVTNKMDVAFYRDKVRILGAYLLNVAGEQRLDNSLSARTLTDKAKWISPNVRTSDSSEAALTQDSLNETLAYNGSTTKTSTLYALPNDADGNSSSGWSARATTLVVEAEINGTKSIYPIELGILRPNTKYEVTLEIHRAGVDPDKPWEKIDFSDAAPSITIKDWTTGASVSETI